MEQEQVKKEVGAKDATTELWCPDIESFDDIVKERSEDEREQDLVIVRSIPKVLTLHENRSFLDIWLQAVDRLIGRNCLYSDWKDLYFELYDLAISSTIFDGRQQRVVIGRMLVLYFVTNLSKRGISLTDCLVIFGVPSKLYNPCITSFMAFMRHMFNFPRYSFEEFNFTGRLQPEGANSNITFATRKLQPNTTLVFKTLRHDDNGDFDCTAFVEIIAHYRLLQSYGPQPNLSNLLGILLSRHHIWFLLPHYQHSFEMFVASSRATPTNVRRAVTQLCQAVQKLHDLGIAHRDLKTHNIMFDSNWDLVLIDFGLCSLSHSTRRQTFPVCTVTTRAPEQLFHEKEDSPQSEFDGKKIDIWSLGCILSAFGNKQAEYIFPGTTVPALQESVTRILGDFDTYISYDIQNTLGVHGVALMRHMLRVNPYDRPTITEILDSYYLDTGKAPMSKPSEEIEPENVNKSNADEVVQTSNVVNRNNKRSLTL